MDIIDTAHHPASADQRSATPAESYRARRVRFAAERDSLSRRGHHLSYARLAAFLLAIAFGVWAEAEPAPLPMIFAALTLLAFFLLISLHRRVKLRAAWLQELVALNDQGLHRLDRNWDALPIRRVTRDLTGHPYAHDLDLYGRASISQILGPVSGVGASVIDDWLLARAEPTTSRMRQEAVRELAPRYELREGLAAHGSRAARASTADLDRFLKWAEADAGVAGRRAILWAARIISALTVTLATLQILGWTDRPFWLLPSAGAILLTMTAGARAQTTFRRAAPGEELITHYPGLLAVAEEAAFQAPLLGEIQHRIAAGGRPASRELARLAQLLHLADLRHSAMLYLPVQLLTLWDFHLLDALERWQRRAGASVRGWIEAAGELEALASIATLAHDQPDWAFAEVVDVTANEPGAPLESAVFEGEAIGHPLLPAKQRVDNDVRVGPPGTFLLVTGSNMSGKSTLLRAIGTNAVLAQAGAPCCARRLRLSPLEIWSCIRVEDSLARGVSYFMAELQRLKAIVDAATRPTSAVHDGRAGRAGLLFLIDEVLNGTTTAERQIAARRVISHLIEAGAIGAVTTHDLDLARGPELAERAELVHFRESLHQDGGERLEMTFDYQLRPGLATSTNALTLLEFVGLPGE
jgi:hypothetical protein